MSFLAKTTLLLCLVSIPHQAFGFTPCKGGLSRIEIVEGAFDPPAIQSPDSQSLRPGGKWPANLIEQGWHNLRKTQRPLTITCFYLDGDKEKVVLPATTDTCFLRNGTSGLVATCQ